MSARQQCPECKFRWYAGSPEIHNPNGCTRHRLARLVQDRLEGAGGHPHTPDLSERTPMSKHTPEPWSHDGKGEIRGNLDDDLSLEPMYSPEDARRIVACVNACAGLSTEALEAGALGRLLTEVRIRQAGGAMFGIGLDALEGK